MSQAITFDTLKYVETLRSAGVSEQQAKAQAEALVEVQAGQLQELATKGDIRELKSDIRAMETDMRADIGNVRTELLYMRWMIGLSLSIAIASLGLLIKLAL